ncbi:MAG TPA: flagellum-specific ATP synthase FliI, partial [Spirochaetales bacterium]|nr:flagellum-specific ATP synthase FliI [Spirochaetales bacterium]
MLEKYQAIIDRVDPILFSGKVEQVQGYLVESQGPQAIVGELCRIHIPRKDEYRAAEVIGLRGNRVQLMCFENLEGIEVGSRVVAEGELLQVPVSEKLL